jgi:biotin operon repressor
LLLILSSQAVNIIKVKENKMPAPGSGSVSTPVLAILRKNPYVEMPTAELVEKSGFTPKQVSNAIHKLRSSGVRIESPMYGIYRYVPGDMHSVKPVTVEQPKPSKLLFEELGRTKSGEIIVEGEDGALYKLCEL